MFHVEQPGVEQRKIKALKSRQCSQALPAFQFVNRMAVLADSFWLKAACCNNLGNDCTQIPKLNK
jgi:hypothetical protein